MSAILKITEATGQSWQVKLNADAVYSIGRGSDNDILLNDRRVSRHHAQIIARADTFKIIDGFTVDGQIQRSVNRVFINGAPHLEKFLVPGDKIVIGETKLEFQRTNLPPPEESFERKVEISDVAASAKTAVTPKMPVEVPANINYDDKPLGYTQVLIPADRLIGNRSNFSVETELVSPEEIRELRRKAQVLDLLYDLIKTLGTVFDLKEIFVKATDLIFQVTSAERVVALLADETTDGKILNYSLHPIAIRARDKDLETLTKKLSISRTITQKVMEEKIALLSQDAAADEQFSASESIVAQGVRSTICAPLITESNVHGVVYADRLDQFSTFAPEDLSLISAIAAQTAVTVETVKAHNRLAREEVARANYGRFMPEYVVKQLLENPDSFRLGGVNQTITILFADIRGFTAFSEREKPEKIVALLNRYLTVMSEVIFANGGTLDKYIGDGLMALFGAPTATPDDAKNAVKTAIAMQKRLLTLNKELAAEGFLRVEIGIGLHTGEATIGYIGSERRSEYTAIGDTVNLASRLESNARGGQILISEETARNSGNSFDLIAHKPLTVKNRLQSVSVFEVKWR